MRVVIQKVTHCSVEIEGKIKSSIGRGLLVLVGVEDRDTDADIEWLSNKIVNMRIFEDANNVMNLSVKDVDGEILIVSQFTLQASTKKGNRPSYIKASKHDFAIPMYEKFCAKVSADLGKTVGTGEFGADMKVSLLNDGPTTIFMDSQNKE
ncbi:MAG: D-aminoacyl-tRNA deacylase [Paludibacteraceae bacterium]|nr:D-aminoacyl-tRNA deacylase [Paludibacteraceae bacterium]